MLERDAASLGGGAGTTLDVDIRPPAVDDPPLSSLGPAGVRWPVKSSTGGGIMKAALVLSLAALVFASAGCYHATIDTGLEPSDQVLRKGFARSWIYGLVPPDIVDTAAKCPHGVARVETRISFVNGLVGAITFNIFTPMEITVTCAAKSMSGIGDGEPYISLEEGATPDEVHGALVLAAQECIATKQPVFVQLP